MNDTNKVKINGKLVKKMRKVRNKSLDKIAQTTLGNQGISKRTLLRIEAQNTYLAKPDQVNLLAKALDISPEMLYCNQSNERKATIALNRITEGRQLADLMQQLHGAVWDISFEPDATEGREHVLETCTYLDTLNKARQIYPKKDLTPIEKLKREYECRELIDKLNINNIGVFAGKHFRFEPVVSEDVHFDSLEAENASYAVGYEKIWAGPLDEEYVDYLAKIGNTIMEGYDFRDLIAVSFKKIVEEEDEQLETLATFDVYPGKAISIPSDHSDKNQKLNFWQTNAIRVNDGKEPLTWWEYDEMKEHL